MLDEPDEDVDCDCVEDDSDELFELDELLLTEEVELFEEELLLDDDSVDVDCTVLEEELLLSVRDDSDDVDGTVNPFVRSCDCTVRTGQNIRRTTFRSKALFYPRPPPRPPTDDDDDDDADDELLLSFDCEDDDEND